MTKSKVLIVLIIVLLVSNLAAWYLLISGKKNRSSRKMQTREFLQKEVGFSSGQLEAFDSLAKSFRESARTEMDIARKKKKEIVKSVVSDQFSDSAVQQGAKDMANAQQNLERLMLIQVGSVRALCRPGQLPAFDAGWEKIFFKKTEGRKRSGG